MRIEITSREAGSIELGLAWYMQHGNREALWAQGRRRVLAFNPRNRGRLLDNIVITAGQILHGAIPYTGRPPRHVKETERLLAVTCPDSRDPVGERTTETEIIRIARNAALSHGLKTAAGYDPAKMAVQGAHEGTSVYGILLTPAQIERLKGWLREGRITAP